MDVEIEPIGRILRGIDGSDEYVLLRYDEEVSTHDLEDWLLSLFYTESTGAGSYFCTSVQVVRHPHIDKYIGIIYHRYDV
jgi:hypothetical protein